jgi:hypothetical protein
LKRAPQGMAGWPRSFKKQARERQYESQAERRLSAFT